MRSFAEKMRLRRTKAFPLRGRWHGEAVTDEVEGRKAPLHLRKTQEPIVGADIIRPNAGRFRRADGIRPYGDKEK